MSYEVTATRRRPQAFDALAGQEFVAETLKNSIQSKKIAHAYLFSGPRGCGKTSTARILAKALNCANGPTATPCGKCQQCLEITKGQSTDVIEIDGASNTSVNDIRQIKDEVLFPPQSSRYKIYIIDEVHMLSTSAFNALLKTIEEPPAYCIFIFATTELHKVPATIKSRCQQFNFRLVPIEKIKMELAEAAKEIGIQADDEALYWVARESTGSMRDAYTLFDQVAAFSGDHITYEKIKDKLGIVGIESLNAIFEAAAKNESENVILKIDEFLQNGISIEQFVTNCTEYLRSVLLIKAGITKESLLGHPKERFSETVLNSWNSIQTERALSILLQLFRDIRYSLSPRYELELAFSKISWLTQYVSPSEVKKAIDEAKNLLLSANVAQPANAGFANPYAAQANLGFANAGATFAAARQNLNQQNQFSKPAQGGAFSSNIFAQNQNKNPFAGKTAFQQSAQSVSQPAFQQNEKASDFSETHSANTTQFANPYAAQANTGRTVSAPRNIFAKPQEQSQPETFNNQNYQTQNPAANANAYSPQTNFTANANGGAGAQTGNFVSAQELTTEDFAPPDPTPSSAPSFSDGGAEPPEQTANAGEINSHQNQNPSSESDFRGKILKELSMHEPMLASSLFQTGEWTKNGNIVSTTVQSSFLKLQLDSNLKKISGFLSKYFGEEIAFQVNLKQQQRAATTENAPAEIKMLCEMFRGQIVGHTKKTEQEIEQAKQEEKNQGGSVPSSDDESDISGGEETSDD
ncbi:MAG: DNA polymerase III subunit gamma/tau [Treponema sp.]|nr:DNA polymerase III subunit gamma/tau [Treponema sp.]